MSRSLWAGILTAMAFGTGLTLACYWLAPATVWRGATHPLADLPAAATVYGISAVIAADMLWLRRRFCSHACPYGALMSLLADKNTLAVRYLDERDDECIGCHKCETDCPMGIDIKQRRRPTVVYRLRRVRGRLQRCPRPARQGGPY